MIEMDRQRVPNDVLCVVDVDVCSMWCVNGG